MNIVERDDHIYRNEFEPRVYLYVLKDRVTQAIRYVGYSCNPYSRFKAHLTGRSLVFQQWLSDLSLAGSGIEMCVVAYVPADVMPEDEERRLIRQYLAAGCDLLNRQQRD